jgi:hypothetical protein
MWYRAADARAAKPLVASPFGGPMLRNFRRLTSVSLVLGAAAAASCHGAPDSTGSDSQSLQAKPQQQATTSVPTLTALRLHVHASDDDSGLHVRPQRADLPATGPTALVVTPQGTLLVLDRLAGRVVGLVAADDSAAVDTLIQVPAQVEDLSVGRDGALLAFSPVRATAWVYEANGEPAGQMTVSRELRGLQHVELGMSRMLQVRTAYQELIDIGSPSAPLPLAVALKTKREGAALLADGRGVAVQVNERRAELLVLRQADQESRSAVDLRFAIEGVVDGARVIGVHETTACVRLEEVSSTPQISVARRAYCVDMHSGNVVLDAMLGAPGSYLPRRELAMGGGYLAFMRPDNDGVSFTRWTLPSQPIVGKPSTGGKGVSP